MNGLTGSCEGLIITNGHRDKPHAPINFGLSKGMGRATNYEPMKLHMIYIRTTTTIDTKKSLLLSGGCRTVVPKTLFYHY